MNIFGLKIKHPFPEMMCLVYNEPPNNRDIKQWCEDLWKLNYTYNFDAMVVVFDSGEGRVYLPHEYE